MGNNSKVPEVRFKGFNRGWDEEIFDNTFVFSIGKNIKQNQASPEFEIPCVRYGELYHMYSEVITKVINRTDLNKNELVFSRGDEILLPSAGEDSMDIGSASALTIQNVAIGRTINILRPKYDSKYNHIYASYYINAKLRVKIASLAKGVSISNVYNSDLSTLTINLPTLPEQTKIGNFFQNLDELLSQHKKKLEKLKTLKKAMLEKMFPKEGESVPEIRFKGFTGDWEETDLRGLYKFQYGMFNNNPSNGGEYPVYGANGIIGGFTEYNSKDSVVIGHMGEYAGIVLWAEGEHFVTYNGIITQPIKKDFLPMFGYFMLYHMDIRKICDGSGQPFLSYETLNNLKSCFPKHRHEQKKISEYFLSIDNLLSNHQKQIEKLENIKKACLSKMFI